ncbi:MAG: CAP domain-containing protein [Planctomycetaceae bacterium]|nr:CAP domain-containing protein [Planctomycetaceae bacterium]
MQRWIFGLCLALAPVFAGADETPSEHDWLVKHPTIQQLVALTNAHRAKSGLQPLRLNPRMCLDAQRHATHMSNSGAMVHSGLPYRENIYMGPRSPQDAVNGWIYSPAHHANMLSGTECGFGYMHRGGSPAWVAVFR